MTKESFIRRMEVYDNGCVYFFLYGCVTISKNAATLCYRCVTVLILFGCAPLYIDISIPSVQDFLET